MEKHTFVQVIHNYSVSNYFQNDVCSPTKTSELQGKTSNTLIIFTTN